MDTKPLCESMEEINQSEGEDGDVEEGVTMSFPDSQIGNLVDGYGVPQNRHQILTTSSNNKGVNNCPRSSPLIGNVTQSQQHQQQQQHSTELYSEQQPQRRPYPPYTHINGNGLERKSLNPMVVVGLDEEQYSSSPFHSATEDFGDNDHDRDRDPLIKPPAKTGGFHQLLNSKLKKQSSSSSFNNDKESHNSGLSDKDDENNKKCSVGIFLAAVSCIFFATSALIVKISRLHPMELLCVRGLIQGILVTPLVISTGSNLVPNGSKSLLFSRAILGSMALVMSFSAIHLLPLSDAATVIFTSPVFVSIFACLCLGEVCGWFDVVMIALTLLGVLLVSKPSFDFVNSGSWTSIGGLGAAVAAAMLTALAFIVLRQLKHIHYSVTVFWFSSVLALFGAVLTIALDGFVLPSDFTSISECIGIGICGFFGQILLTKALQIESAGPVSIVRTLDIVLAFFFQVTFLHDIPDWKSYLGSVLVVACVILTAFRRWHRERGSSGLAKSPSPSSSNSQLNPNR